MKKIILILNIFLWISMCSPAMDSIRTAREITSDGNPYSSSFDEEHYYDIYKFQGVAGKNYLIETGSASNEMDTVLSLIEEDYTLIVENDDYGDSYLSMIDFECSETKTYYIIVESYNLTVVGPYSIKISEKVLPTITTPLEKKDWTILCYFAADNNLTPDLYEDVVEMVSAGGSDSNVNVVVAWDESEVYGGYRHGYYYITSAGQVKVRDTGEINTGDPDVVKSFIDYGIYHFPADRYMFILSDHGGGVDRKGINIIPQGVCWDDSTITSDYLTETEQASILSYLSNKIGDKIDILGYDACLMGMAEVMYLARNYADVFVGSEMTEPGAGWDYHFLTNLKANPTISSSGLAQVIVESYSDYYTLKGFSSWTLASADLSQMDNFAGYLNSFIVSTTNSGIHPNIIAGLKLLSEDFEGVSSDLVGYLKVVEETFSGSELATNAGILAGFITNQLILSEAHSTNYNGKVFGAAITLYPDTTVYSLLEFCEDTLWDEFVDWANFPEPKEMVY